MKAVLCLFVLALLAASAVAVDDTNLAEVEVEDELTAKLFRPGKGFAPMKKPSNTLPKTNSDKSKPSKPKDAAGTPAPKLTSNASAKKAGAPRRKLHKKELAGVTVVNKSQWNELKGIKVGQKLSNWINKVGGAIKNALSNFVKGIINFFRPGSKTRFQTADKVCHWVAAVDSSYRATSWSETSMRSDDKYGSWKPGTCCVGSMVQRFGSRNCFSDATQKSNPQTASAFANANFVCLDKAGTMVSPPGNCKAKIQFYGAYKGNTYSWSDSGWVCPFGSRYIQASAAHEAQLQVGTSTLASKGAVTSTGNSITETYSFTLTAGASAGVGKDGPEASANVGMSFGYTVQEVRDFGEKANVVAFQHQGPFDVPFNAIITTVAASQINGGGRVFGYASSETEGWLMCVVATSTDCGMPNTGVYYGVGTQEQLNLYTRACDAIKSNNGVRFSELGF